MNSLLRRVFLGRLAALPAALTATRLTALEVADPGTKKPEVPSLDKDRKELRKTLKALREAKLDQAVEPAFLFRALPKEDGK